MSRNDYRFVHIVLTHSDVIYISKVLFGEANSYHGRLEVTAYKTEGIIIYFPNEISERKCVGETVKLS